MEMDEPLLTDQYWRCFKLSDSSGELAIARVRLPDHTESNVAVNEESKLYSVEYEVAMLHFHRDQNIKFSVPIPEVYAFERPSSDKAAAVGGYDGKTLENTAEDLVHFR